MLTEIRTRSQITIPNSIIKELKLKIGDKLHIDIEKGNIIMKPVIAIPREQAYFWTDKWQEEEKKVNEEIKTGKINSAETPEELFEDLEL